MIILQAHSPRPPCLTIAVRLILLLPYILTLFAAPVQAQPSSQPTSQPFANQNYRAAAREVTRHIQAAFFLPDDDLYAHSLADRTPEFMWGNGIMFSALLGAARHDPQTYAPVVARFFKSLDGYWDTLDSPPGYEPS